MRKYFNIILSVLFSVLMVSCSFFTPSEKTSIVVNLPGVSSRTAAPDNLSYYKVNAFSDAGFDETKSTKDNNATYVEFTELDAGNYVVIVLAFDKDDVCLSKGSSNVTVRAGERTEAKIILQAPDPDPEPDPVPVKVTGINVTAPSTIIYGGQTLALTAEVSPSDAEDKTLTWSSSDKNILTVDSDGKVTGVSYGTATITAAANDGSGVKGTIEITVPSVTISYAAAFVTATSVTHALTSSSYTLTVFDLPEPSVNGYVFEGWYTDTTYATKYSAGDTITGDVTLYAKFTQSYITSITVTGSTTVYKDQIITLTAEVSPSTVKDTSITWSSSDTSIATVDSDGKVTGVSGGTTTITATANDGSGVTGSLQVTVPSVVIQYSTSLVSVDTVTRTLTSETYTLTEEDLPELSYENYTFEGWYADGALTEKLSVGDTITYSTTFYAKWSNNVSGNISAVTVSISAKYDGMTDDYSTGAAIPYNGADLIFTAETTGTIDSYSWTLNGTELTETTSALTINPFKSTDFNLSGTNTLSCVVTSGSVTKSAAFEFTFTDLGFVTITYVSEYGTRPTVTKSLDDGTYKLTEDDLPELYDDSYNFAGWYSDSAYTVSEAAGNVITADITLYAKWTPKVTSDINAVTISISAKSNVDGTETSYESGSEITYSTNLTFTADTTGTIESYAWTLNGTTLSETTASITFNPYTSTDFDLDGTNVITCVVKSGTITKSDSFEFTFTGTGL